MKKNVKKNLKEVFAWIFILTSILLSLLWIKHLVLEYRSPIQCWIVIKSNFSDIQYVWQNSKWVVELTGWYKSFNTRDYVIVWDTICMNWDSWEKMDSYLILE